MPKTVYSTVPDELVHVAESAYAYLVMHGFKVRVEKGAIDYPRTPTLVARRGHSTLFIEVANRFDREVALAWWRYGGSCTSDVEFGLVLPNQPGVSQSELEFATKHKIGIFTVDAASVTTQLLGPVDLALHVFLPDLPSLPPKVRSIVAPFYSKFERGDWRDGFADGCLAVEEESRRYLRARVAMGGVQILDAKGKVIKLTVAKINKSTLGQLAWYFLGITAPNTTDSLLAKTLPTINPDRVGAVHKRHSASIERKLRATAGRRMHAIVNCIRELKTRP